MSTVPLKKLFVEELIFPLSKPTARKHVGHVPKSLKCPLCHPKSSKAHEWSARAARMSLGARQRRVWCPTSSRAARSHVVLQDATIRNTSKVIPFYLAKLIYLALVDMVLEDTCEDKNDNCVVNGKFCDHPDIGEQIKDICPKTCGVCQPEDDSELVRVLNKCWTPTILSLLTVMTNWERTNVKKWASIAIHRWARIWCRLIVLRKALH